MTPTFSPRQVAALGLVVATLSMPAAFAAANPHPHDHDPAYTEDTSRDPEALLRAYGHNSHLQKLLDLGLYQVVFDDDPTGIEAFLAAGAHVEGLRELPLTPMAFATWRHETRSIRTLNDHGAKPVADATDADQLVRKTMDTVAGVSEGTPKEMAAAESEYRQKNLHKP